MNHFVLTENIESEQLETRDFEGERVYSSFKESTMSDQQTLFEYQVENIVLPEITDEQLYELLSTIA
ncbi:hypothetical protein [Marinifilum fragile]|uniref:hypothetical protein n=1 Tax=Marinifilum fragile TaxID=570161 RepID=UPI0006CF4EBE|nr:hypothetical protein [Marinifilum fragile]